MPFILAIVLLGLLGTLFCACQYSLSRYTYVGTPQLVDLDDNHLLEELPQVLHKSHNSCAVQPYSFWECLPWMWAKCQTMSVYDQLQHGVRALDLRVAWKHGTVRIGHRLLTRYTLQSALDEVRHFLQKHPSEFVLVFLARDYNRRHTWGLDQTEHMWNQVRAYGNTESPAGKTVRDLRGHMHFVAEAYLAQNESAEDLIHTIKTWDAPTLQSVKRRILDHLQPSTWTEVGLNYLFLGGALPPIVVALHMNAWFDTQEAQGPLVVGADMTGPFEFTRRAFLWCFLSVSIAFTTLLIVKVVLIKKVFKKMFY